MVKIRIAKVSCFDFFFYFVYIIIGGVKMGKIFLMVFVLILSLTLFNCDPNSGEENPLPVLNSISPVSKVSHMPSFTLTASGTDFVSGSTIVFDGVEKQTFFVSDTEISCKIDPGDILVSLMQTRQGRYSSSADSGTVPVLVRNPSPGGGDSGSLDFTIHDNHTFIAPQKLSSSPDSHDPDIAADNQGNVNVVWGYSFFISGDNYERLVFTRSTNGGTSWSPIVVAVDTDRYLSGKPSIGVDSAGNIDVVWEVETLDHMIFYCQSANSGTTWSPAVQITQWTNASYTPVIGVSVPGNINAAWSMATTNNYEIFFARSVNNGAFWSNWVNISNSSLSSLYPDIAVDSAENLNVVWEESNNFSSWEIFFSRSINYGISWTTPVNLSNTQRGGSYNPAIAVDNTGNINVAWRDDIPVPGIYFRRSVDRGVSWSQSVKISDIIDSAPGTAITSAGFPAIAIDGAGNINVGWKDIVTGNSDIFFSRSTDNGATWSAPLNVSSSAGSTSTPGFWGPKITVDPLGNIYFVWQSADRNIYFSTNTR